MIDALLDDSVSVESVHIPSATAQVKPKQMTITAAKRKSLPTGEFALPALRKYPIDTAARTRNAAARLEQNKSTLSPAQYSQAKGRIATAAKKFGIKSEYAKKSGRSMGGGKGLNMKISTDGSIHVRHMGEYDRCIAYLPCVEIDLSGEVTTMADAKKLVWNKLATFGTFLGHQTGAFKMDADTFKQVEKNFKRDGIDVVFDYEHSSEQPVNESPAKSKGEAVASGWIKDVQARADGLYGLVDWTDSARKKILSGEMKYISPAIRFGAIDGKSGEKVGAKLTSSALTLKPFLKDLPPALASDSEYTAFLCSEISTTELADMASASPGGYAVGQNEFMRRFRSMLNLDDMASPSEMMDKVERLQELCDMADGDPTAIVQGVNLNNYIPQLREFMRMPANTTLDDMLCAVCEMICSTMPSEEDSEGADMSDIPTEEAPVLTNETCPAPVILSEETKIMDTILLSEHTVKLSEAVATAIAPYTLQLKDAEAKVAEAVALKAVAEAKIVELTDQIKTRDEAAVTSRVDEAFETYKDTKKLSEDDKAAMPIVLATNPALFDKLYPKLAPSKRVLLSTLSSEDTSVAKSFADKTVPALSKLLSDVQSKNPKMSYDDAFSEALSQHNKLLVG